MAVVLTDSDQHLLQDVNRLNLPRECGGTPAVDAAPSTFSPSPPLLIEERPDVIHVIGGPTSDQVCNFNHSSDPGEVIKLPGSSTTDQPCTSPTPVQSPEFQDDGCGELGSGSGSHSGESSGSSHLPGGPVCHVKPLFFGDNPASCASAESGDNAASSPGRKQCRKDKKCILQRTLRREQRTKLVEVASSDSESSFDELQYNHNNIDWYLSSSSSSDLFSSSSSSSEGKEYQDMTEGCWLNEQPTQHPTLPADYIPADYGEKLEKQRDRKHRELRVSHQSSSSDASLPHSKCSTRSRSSLGERTCPSSCITSQTSSSWTSDSSESSLSIFCQSGGSSQESAPSCYSPRFYNRTPSPEIKPLKNKLGLCCTAAPSRSSSSSNETKSSDDEIQDVLTLQSCCNWSPPHASDEAIEWQDYVLPTLQVDDLAKVQDNPEISAQPEQEKSIESSGCSSCSSPSHHPQQTSHTRSPLLRYASNSSNSQSSQSPRSSSTESPASKKHCPADRKHLPQSWDTPSPKSDDLSGEDGPGSSPRCVTKVPHSKTLTCSPGPRPVPSSPQFWLAEDAYPCTDWSPGHDTCRGEATLGNCTGVAEDVRNSPDGQWEESNTQNTQIISSRELAPQPAGPQWQTMYLSTCAEPHTSPMYTEADEQTEARCLAILTGPQLAQEMAAASPPLQTCSSTTTYQPPRNDAPFVPPLPPPLQPPPPPPPLPPDQCDWNTASVAAPPGLAKQCQPTWSYQPALPWPVVPSVWSSVCHYPPPTSSAFTLPQAQMQPQNFTPNQMALQWQTSYGNLYSAANITQSPNQLPVQPNLVGYQPSYFSYSHAAPGPSQPQCYWPGGDPSMACSQPSPPDAECLDSDLQDCHMSTTSRNSSTPTTKDPMTIDEYMSCFKLSDDSPPP